MQATWWMKLASQQKNQQKKKKVWKAEVRDLLVKLKECSTTKDLQRGQQVHAEAIKTGNDSSIYVATALVNMYAKCRCMVDAHQVFDSIKDPNVVSWTSLILGYAENGEGVTSLNLFSRMKSEGFAPSSITFISALKACSLLERSEYLERGRQIHSEITCKMETKLQNTLIDMYAKCGSMIEARQVFDSMEEPTMVSWTALIMGYAEKGEGAIALDLFSRMKNQACTPDRITFVAVLKACISLAIEHDESGKAACLQMGRQIHSEMGSHSNTYIHNTLIDLYAKCGRMVEARQVFDAIKRPDVVSWNTLILGYAENGDGFTSLDLFSKMKFQGYVPDYITVVAALKACTSLALEDESGKAECQERGKQIYLNVGSNSNIYVQNTLIDMYAKCGNMFEARQVFDDIKHRDVISWTALIMGYADNGEAVTALDLFVRMRSEGCSPNCITFVAAFKACGLLGSLESGKIIHAQMDSATEAVIVTCLVDFYAKCGCLIQAQKIFDTHPEKRDLRTWTALIAGYSRLGDNQAVFRIVKELEDAGFRPNSITFLNILTSCSHAGFVEKAREFFEEMCTTHGIRPDIGHCNCMVDILARSDKLDDSMALLRSMSCTPDHVTWKIVLDACRKRKNVGIGSLAFESLVSLGEKTSSLYVQMAHIYGSRGMWEEQEMVLGMRQNSQLLSQDNFEN